MDRYEFEGKWKESRQGMTQSLPHRHVRVGRTEGSDA